MIATENLLDKVMVLLKTRFSDSTVILPEPADDEKLSGFLLWDGFAGQPMIQRQRTVGNLLRSELSSEERRNTSAIFTLTPDEYELMLEDFDSSAS